MERISIALCTYNGATYLKEQLDSIASQTRLPDEMMIRDDRSTDNTVEIIKSFIKTAKFPVHLEINPSNLGSCKNFEAAVQHCSGDIIFLSDQDDVWHQDKIHKMSSYLIKFPDTGGVFCNAVVTDQMLQSKGFSVWDTLNFNISRQRQFQKGKSFNLLLRRNVVTGAALAFRSDFKKLILPIPDSWVHDGWIALMIAAISGMGIISEPLVYYRQHDDNQIGATKKGVWRRINESLELNRKSYYDADILAYKTAYLRLLPHSDHEKLNLLEEKLRHLHVRSSLPKSRFSRIPVILKELLTLRYHRYSRHWQVAVRDLIML